MFIKRFHCFIFPKKEIVIDKVLLKRTIDYSWVTAMQQSCLYIGKVLVQAAVNRIDDFAFTPQQNIGHAMTTFLAQNRGAKKHERIKKGFWLGMKIETVYCSICLFACAKTWYNWNCSKLFVGVEYYACL